MIPSQRRILFYSDNSRLYALVRPIFFGNYFYGICAVALSIEATVQQQYPLNSFIYYIAVFSATVLYYTHAYIADPSAADLSNPRSAWYSRNSRAIRISQVIHTVVFLSAAGFIAISNLSNIRFINWQEWLMLGIFPIIAALYYGSASPGRATHNLRNHGWIKPFVIGFVWAGPVTWYPVLMSNIEAGTSYTLTLQGFLLFVKNFMFITMLCIMFDFKDYAADHNRNLKTFVVSFGLRKTIFLILIPLTAIGLGTFLLYASIQNFPVLRIIINTIPFVLLIIVAYSMHRRKSILYYLAIIDGLMLVKAACGFIGFSLIK